MATSRREAAERWRSAILAEARLRSRFRFAVLAIVLVSTATSAVDLRFGVASVLLLGVLVQLSVERMRERLRAAAVSSRQTLGWAEEAVSTEEILARLDRFLEQR